MAEKGHQEIGNGLIPALVRRYASAVRAVCIANTPSIHDAEDVMQDVFATAVAKIDGLREADKAGAWLMQIARRRCIDHARQRKQFQPLPKEVADSVEDDNPRAELLHDALRQLPDGYREAIALYYLDGRSCASVASTLGISEAAVRQRLARARLQLHQLLKERA